MVPKLNEGGQRLFPALPDGFWSKVRKYHWKLLGGDGAKRELRKRKEKVAAFNYGGARR